MDVYGKWGGRDGPSVGTEGLGFILTKTHKNMDALLAGWLSWLEHCPIHQKVKGSFPSQGTYLCCGFNPQLGS